MYHAWKDEADKNVQDVLRVLRPTGILYAFMVLTHLLGMMDDYLRNRDAINWIKEITIKDVDGSKE